MGSSKGSAPTGGQFNSYGASGGGAPYQSQMGGQYDPYAPSTPYMSSSYGKPTDFNKYRGSPIGAGNYNAQDYAYKTPEYSVGGSSNIEGLISSMEGDAQNQMGLMSGALDQRAAASGMSGGSRHGTAMAQGMNDINRGLMSATSNVRYQDNQAQLQRQQAEAESRRQMEQQDMWQQQSAAQQQQQMARDQEQQAYNRAFQQQQISMQQEAIQRAAQQQQRDNPQTVTNSAGRTWRGY